MNITLLKTAVLSALATEPRHGYGILQDVETSSGGRLNPPVGSLYRVIDALTRDGLVIDDRTETVDGRKRRYYRLTPSGRDVLVAEVEAIEAVATASRRRLAVFPKPKPVGGATA